LEGFGIFLRDDFASGAAAAVLSIWRAMKIGRDVCKQRAEKDVTITTKCFFYVYIYSEILYTSNLMAKLIGMLN
jgi:hypothetical protein